MPKGARDSVRKGPLAALLVLFGLFASAGAIAGGTPTARETAARPGAARPGAAAATLCTADDGLPDEAGSAFLSPPRPRIVVTPLSARPAAQAAPAPVAAPRQRAASPYRARAPPSA
ncbi:hypothetical protein [Allosphingosinicella deserti]|uniref:Uncharacterized protein n=1 Tax=Allosphingosinicella deserti TaxID=2116704 RepID=A0A2P7QRL9_9SPHN|nr:hypothetical protein [Sphingomonas deserti]PSJ40599.1 hypothetical protein C7I55_09750 [Sphingomonas deserti]